MERRARAAGGAGAVALAALGTLAALAAACGARTSVDLEFPGAVAVDAAEADEGETPEAAPADVASSDAVAPEEEPPEGGLAEAGAPEASRVDGPDGTSTPEAGPLDAHLDAADASVDDAPASDASDATVANFAPPRPIAPLPTATVTSQTPLLRWLLATGTDGASIDVCRDRACTVIVMTVTAPGSSVVLPTALIQGVYFWRLHGMSGSAVGAAASPMWEFFVGALSAPQNTSWGSTLDVNGDGYPDVMVGAPNLSGNTENAYLFLGGSSGLSRTPTEVTYAGDPDGYDEDPIASAGDVDGDGFADVVIGVPNYATNKGSILLFSGGAGGLATIPTTISSANADGIFGWTVSGAGDVNGDGYADVIVGGYATNNASAGAFLYYGSPDGLTGAPTEMLAGVSDAGLYADYGRIVAGAGDLDGDGFADIVVGSVSGRHAYVYYGSASGVATTPQILTDPNLPDEADAFPSFGAAVACAGDVNGDGFADLLVGASENGDSYAETGDTYVYLGGASGLSATAIRLVEPAVGSGVQFGSGVAGGGDVNGDGYADLLAETVTGSYLYLGGPGGPSTQPIDLVVPGGENNSEGGSLASAGDVDGDGYADVLVGSPFSNSYLGGAYIFMGAAQGPGTAVALTNPNTTTASLFGASVQ